MKFIKNTTWPEIFAGWRNREASDPGWIEVATKVKGWPDWESWRNFSASQIKAPERDWQIFEFDNPMEEIPAMLVGPYTSWQSRHPNTNNFTFSDLVEIESEYAYWKETPKIKSIITDFPAPTEFIGLIREDNNKIICIEGHHRATAVAIAQKQNQPILFSKNPTIALANLPLADLGLLDILLKRGSTKNPV